MKANYQDILAVCIDQQNKLLYSRLLRTIKSNEYQEMLNYVLSLINEFEVNYWVIESTGLYTPNQNDKNWTAQEFGIQLIQTSLKRVAIMHKDNVVVEVTLASIRKKFYQIFGKDIQIELFQDLPAALNWIHPELKDNLFLTEIQKQNTVDL